MNSGVRIEFEAVVRRTDRALLLSVDGEEVWIPDSQIEYIDERDGVLYIPEWLAQEKGLL